MNHPGPEHWKALGCLIGYIKGKKIKGIIIRNPKVLKGVIFMIPIMPQIRRQERVPAV